MNIVTHITRYVAIGLTIVLLSACHSMSSTYSGDYADTQNGARTYGAGNRGEIYGQVNQLSANQLRELRNTTIFYFGFDKDTVNRDDVNAIAAHGLYLAKHPNAGVTLEGHTDQRGSREYNVGLGERRDKTVKQLLEMNGANPNQIKMVSYGQEKPAAFGHDEASYAQNRRVEIIYQQYS